MPTTTLLLVRHAEADGHDDDDPALTDHGREQAAAVASRLVADAPDAVLHGRHRRAVDTAAVIAAACGLTPGHSAHADDRTPIPDDWSLVPERVHTFLRSVPDDERDPGGRLLDRAVAELGQVGPADRTLVVVTHNFVIGWFVRTALDAPWDAWIGLNAQHAALTSIRFEPGRRPTLVRFNDVGHLLGR